MTHQKKETAMAMVRRLEDNAADIESGLGEESDLPPGGEGKTVARKLFGYTAKRLSGADPEQAMARVRGIRREHPEWTDAELVERLIKSKCQQTAAIGAATSASSIVPVFGTAISLTVGLVVDISSTLKLHAELVLEIAEAHGHRLTEAQRSEVILAVTGLSTGFGQLGGQATKAVSRKVGEMAAQRWLAKAIPAIGMAASASTNVLSTYIIGKRADAYFVRGPEALGDFKDNLRAISGVDERKLAGWVKESSQSVARASANAGQGVAATGKRGVDCVVDAGQKTGRAVTMAVGKGIDTGRSAGKAVSSGVDKSAKVISKTGKAITEAVVGGVTRTIDRVAARRPAKDAPGKTENEEPADGSR